MCTVTWVHTADGYIFFFNRDEKYTRAVGGLPEWFELRGVRCLAPSDTDCGGTWTGVNEYGLSFGILNGYSRERNGAPRVSRGLLLRNMLPSRSLQEFEARLRSEDLHHYSAFTAVCIEPGFPATAATWDGNSLWFSTDADSLMPFTSSSFEPELICSTRRQTYAQLCGSQPQPESMVRYHTTHAGGRGPASVCMHRDDASTVSHTRIQVSRQLASLHYIDGPPCAGGEVRTWELPLRTSR